MTAILYIGCALAICAVVALVRMGCRSIITLAGDIDRDSRSEYRVQPELPKRDCPQWIKEDAQ